MCTYKKYIHIFVHISIYIYICVCVCDMAYKLFSGFSGLTAMFGNVGGRWAARWPWEALGSIFVEQRFGLNPPEEQRVDRSSHQEGRLFETTYFSFFFFENDDLLVGSLLNKDSA